MKIFFVLLIGVSFSSFSQTIVNTSSGSVNSVSNKPFFQFLLKENGVVLYSYDSTNLDRGLVAIESPTKENLIAAMNAVEKKYQLKLSEDDIVIRGNAGLEFVSFKLVKTALKEKQLFKFRVIAEGAPAGYSLDSSEKEMDTIPISKKTLVILLAANNEIYYYRGNNCDQMLKTDFNQIETILRKEKKNTSLKDLFIAIKATAQSTFKNAIDLLDVIVQSNIPAKHYAEMDITATEMACIEKFKKQ